MASDSRKSDTRGDSFVERLGDRLSAAGTSDGGLPRPGPLGSAVGTPSANPPPDTKEPHKGEPFEDAPTTVATAPQSRKGSEEVPYVVDEGSAEDPFAEFEDGIEGESTRIDAESLMAEESTTILNDAPQPPYLEVESGKDQGKEFVLNPGVTSVGRSIDNDVILTDISVSRRHLRVIREPDGSLRLNDLGSGNGSQLNGQRVGDAPLAEGDRVSLGETVLVVRIPGETAPAAGAGPEGSSQRTADHRVPASLPLSPEQRDSPTIPPAGRSHPAQPPATQASFVRGMFGNLPRPWLIALLGLGGLLLLSLGMAVTAMLIRGGGPSPEQRAAIAEQMEFNAGAAAYESRQWEQAREHFGRVLEKNPSNAPAQSYLARLAAIREDENTLDMVQEALEGGDWDAALSHLTSIAEDSAVRAAPEYEARLLAARAGKVRSLVEEGKRALLGDDRELAQALLTRARGVDPRSELVAELVRAIEEAEAQGDPADSEGRPPRSGGSEVSSRMTSGRGRGRTPRGERPNRTEPSGEQRGSSSRVEAQVMNLYRSGQFSAAADAARSGADGAPEGTARTLRRLARAVEAFERQYAEAQRSDLARTIQRAYDADRRIGGGYYSPQLAPRLLEAYLADARAARSAGNQVASCKAAGKALRVDASHGEARRISRACEQRAQALVERAAGLEGSNREQALVIYRQVLDMAPARSTPYLRAYRRVNELARGTPEDEDE